MTVFRKWLRVAAATAALAGAGAVAQAQEIKFWTLSFDNPNVAKAYQSIIKDFEAANPGVTVKLENRGTDEHKSALRVAGGSDQAPDIYFMWAGLGLGGEFIKSGLAAPMDKYYTQYKWDDEFIAPALAFSKQYTGGRFGLPSTFRGEAIYYNKALFQKAGINSEPKTYDELLADADKLAAAGIPAFTFGGTVNWHVMRLMDEILEVKCGPEKHDALMSMKVSWADEPCATQSFEELHKWTSRRPRRNDAGRQLARRPTQKHQEARRLWRVSVPRRDQALWLRRIQLHQHEEQKS
jgi:raffinose/stachyose/melibiose transport system substrate-binding protein